MKTSPLCRSRYWVLAALLSSGLLNSAQASDDQDSVEALKQDTQELAQKLENYSADQRDEAIRSISKTLKALDARIDRLETELKENWDDMSDATRDKTRKSLDALRAQREQAGHWYERLKGSSSSAWGSMKKGFSDAYDKLSGAWQDSERELNNDKPAKLKKSI